MVPTQLVCEFGISRHNWALHRMRLPGIVTGQYYFPTMLQQKSSMKVFGVIKSGECLHMGQLVRRYVGKPW